jgi:hypothetical protein
LPNQALVDAIKEIVNLGKSGDADGANARWTTLFASPNFAAYRPEDQRQALKFVILAKRSGQPSPSLVEVHRAALGPLVALTEAHAAPADYELLGLSQLVTGDAEAAAASFRAGLQIERAAEPGSSLCGRLMKHLSAT